MQVEAFFGRVYIWPGTDDVLIEIKALVDQLSRGLKIEIYSREHSPPHFHVKSSDVDASFTLDKCELLNGNVSSKDEKLIQYWHRQNRKHLIEVWNKTRPSDCVVGEFVNDKNDDNGK